MYAIFLKFFNLKNSFYISKKGDLKMLFKIKQHPVVKKNTIH